MSLFSTNSYLGLLGYPSDERAASSTKSQTQGRSASSKNLDSYMRELNDLIGMDEVKNQVHALVNFLRIQSARKERGLPIVPMPHHLVFEGNPGTGKTTVARILAKIYASLGVVSKGTFVETDRAGLVAGYVGQTALKTDAVIKSARGGILFIDEAYSLIQDDRDSFGREAIDCLLKRMEDYRDDLVVIVAGYRDQMELFLSANPGLKSRFSHYIQFENYNLSALMKILEQIVHKNGYVLQPQCSELFKKQLDIQLQNREFTEHFSNGRYIRSLFEKLTFAQSNRLSAVEITSTDDNTLITLTVEDLQAIIADHAFEKTF